MVCLGSVPRGHTGDVRFILDCFSPKRGKLLVTITVLPALDILIFPNEYVFRKSIYRRKRFTSFLRRVLTQKRPEESLSQYIDMEGRIVLLVIVLFDVAHGSSFGKARSPEFLTGKENSSKCFHVPPLLSDSNGAFKTHV